MNELIRMTVTENCCRDIEKQQNKENQIKNN